MHLAASCPSQRKCPRCGDAHDISDCQMATPLCCNCNVVGHASNSLDCPSWANALEKHQRDSAPVTRRDLDTLTQQIGMLKGVIETLNNTVQSQTAEIQILKSLLTDRIEIARCEPSPMENYDNSTADLNANLFDNLLDTTDISAQSNAPQTPQQIPASRLPTPSPIAETPTQNFSPQVLEEPLDNIVLTPEKPHQSTPLQEVVKIRNSSQLSLDHLKTMHKALETKKGLQLADVEEKWRELGIQEDRLDDLIDVGEFSGGEIDWLNFLGLAVSLFEEDMCKVMASVCEVINGDQGVPLAAWRGIYQFVASMDGDIKQRTMDRVLSHLETVTAKQNGLVYSRDFRTTKCPRLW